MDASNLPQADCWPRGELRCIRCYHHSMSTASTLEKESGPGRRFPSRCSVDQSTVEEPISILFGGLKERYEVTTAYVASLETRWWQRPCFSSPLHVADRFLPDKAIDLME